MNKIHVVDLHFLGEKHAIGAFLIESKVGPILIETGPETTYDMLCKGVEAKGFKIQDIQHVLLTHIHFDHAGAAWNLAQHGATIYVHPVGLPHLANPEKLWNSAALIYGDQMDCLWGAMKPIPEKQLVGVDDGEELDFDDVKINVLYTPGHAVHHNAYQYEDVIFTGDVAGVKIGDGPVVAPCPPPDINIELWKSSIEKIRNAKPRMLYLTHFSEQLNPDLLLSELSMTLDKWASFIKPFYDRQTPADQIVPVFMEFVQNDLRSKGLDEHDIQVYEYANPSWMSVNGLLRYWKLKDQGRL